jgi:hypothetical protein
MLHQSPIKIKAIVEVVEGLPLTLGMSRGDPSVFTAANPKAEQQKIASHDVLFQLLHNVSKILTIVI